MSASQQRQQQQHKKRQQLPLRLCSMLLFTASCLIDRSFAFVILPRKISSFSSLSTRCASCLAQQYKGITAHSKNIKLHPSKYEPQFVTYRSMTTKKTFMTTTTSTTTGGGDTLSSLLGGRNLVSIEDCIKASKFSKERGENGGDGGVVFIDGSWYHRGGRNGREEFKNGPRIQGARYIDMDDIATTKELFPNLNPKGLPHMLPPKELFAATMDALSISNKDHIIIYGKEGCIFTPRTWFLFRSLGHDTSRVHLMQGSLEDYIKEGGDVDEERVDDLIEAKNLNLNEEFKYKARDAMYVVDMDGMKEAVDEDSSSSPLILDPRGSSFASGHVPGAIHVPYASIHTPDDTLKIKSTDELKDIFQTAGVDVLTDRTILCSCGSGVSVCHLVLALEECGRNVQDGKTKIYDGSWAEWGSDPDTPKAVEGGEENI